MEALQSLFSSQQQPENQPIHTASTDGALPDNAFTRTAAELGAEYGGGAGAPGASGDGISAGVGVDIIPPEKPFCSAESVSKWVKLFFKGLENAHGARWALSSDEIEAYSEATAAMLNEQAPRWLAESENKALYMWLFATALLVGSRSESGERIIKWLMDKISSFGKKEIVPQPVQGAPA